jgi:Ca2+/Na+ antiporter
LLAHWLGKPETVAATQRYGPEVIEGSHYLEDKEFENVIGLGYSFGAGLFGLILLVVITVATFIQTKNLTYFAILSVMTVAFLVYVLYLGKRNVDELTTASRGRRGEDAIVEKLRGALDNQWTIFRNLHLPDRKDDLDVVLVGPGGVWVTEVKAYSGTIRFQSGNWERQTKRGWTKLDFNPSRQVTRNAKRLNDYLKREGIVRFVERAIAIAKPQPISNFDSADIPIWLLPTIEEQVAKLSTKTSPTQKEIEQLKALFKGLAEKQISKEETK